MSAGDSDNFLVSYCKQLLRGWKQPVLLGVAFLALWGVLELAWSFPAIRACGYPIGYLLRSESSGLSVTPYSPVFTSEEKPAFLVSSERDLFYRIKVISREALLRDVSDPVEKQRLSLNPFLDLPEASLDLKKIAALDSIYDGEGIFAPRHAHLAQARLVLPRTLPAGDYLIQVEARPLIGQQTERLLLPFRVTDLGAIIKTDCSRTKILAFDLVKRKVLSGVDIEIFERSASDDSKRSSLIRTTTGADGFAEVEFPQRLREDQSALTRLLYDIRRGKDRAYLGNFESDHLFQMRQVSEGWRNGPAGSFVPYDASSRYRCQLSFDKPLYRLGETVSFSGQIAMLTLDGIELPDKQVGVKLSVRDPEFKEVFEGEVLTGADGSFSVSLNPEKLKRTGIYEIDITHPDNDRSRAAFFIDQYRKPDFKVSGKPLKERFVDGDKVQMDVQCNYFFGAPVKNAEVSYAIRSFRKLNFESATRYQRNHMSSVLPVMYKGKVRTDGDGIARIEFVAPRPDKKELESRNYDFSDRDFQVEIEAVDLSRKVVSKVEHVIVDRGTVDIALKPERYLYSSGEKMSVDIRASDNKTAVSGLPVVMQVGYWRPGNSGFYDARFIEVYREEAATDQSGNAQLGFSIPDSLKTGAYDIRVTAHDSGGNLVGSRETVHIVSNEPPEYFENTGMSPQSPIKVELDKEDYRPGDTVRALVALPESKKPVVLVASLEGTSLGTTMVLPVKGRKAIAEFKLPEEFCFGREVTVAAVLDNHKPVVESADIKMPLALKELDVQVLCDQDRYEPGETARVEIVVHDKNTGKPVSNAWCSSSVIDESVHELAGTMQERRTLPDSEQSIEETIYRPFVNRVATRFTFSDYFLPVYERQKLFDGRGFFLAGIFSSHEFHMMSRAAGDDGISLGGPANDVYYAEFEKTGKRSSSKTAFRIPVRSDFKDALAWQPHLMTDTSGKARFSVKLSDDLTTWRVSTTVFDKALDFGQVHSNFRVSRDFIATLALPRFYTRGDETAITALVHNLTDSAQKVNLSLDTSEQIQLNNYQPSTVNLAAGESIRHGWPATIKRAGQASLKLTARGASVNASDAVAQKIPVNDLGYRMYLSSNGILKDEVATASLPLKLPIGTDLAASSLRLELAPSLIGPVTGGYENLIQYPYGCTEQTLGRLIPSVVARRLKNELALHLPDAMEGKFDGIRSIALTKLKESQNGDGGWGWFKASKSDIYMTAQVMEGLYQMQQAGFKMIGFESMRANGLRYLESAVQSRATLPFDCTTRTDMARAIYVLSLYGKKLNPIAKANTFLRVDEMPPEALSYLVLAFKKQGEPNLQIVYERLKLLANEDIRYTHYDHTERMLKMLDGGKGNPYTYRYTGVETTALALRAVAAVEPDDDILLERMASWLILERDQNGWNNTKCTASVLTALLEKELAQGIDRKTDFTVDLSFLGGVSKHLDFDKTIEQEERSIQLPLVNPQQSPGQKSGLVIKKSGPGWLYFTSILSCMRPLSPGEQPVLKSLPEDLKLRSEFYKLTRTVVKNETAYRKTLLGPGDVLRADELVMMRVEVDAPSSYPYVLLEAPLPSGAEVQDNTLRILDEKGKEEPAASLNWYTHKDRLDDKIAFFAERLPAGKNSFTAFLRLEMPGVFNVIPAHLETMYSNKVRAHSKASLLKVK